MVVHIVGVGRWEALHAQYLRQVSLSKDMSNNDNNFDSTSSSKPMFGPRERLK